MREIDCCQLSVYIPQLKFAEFTNKKKTNKPTNPQCPPPPTSPHFALIMCGWLAQSLFILHFVATWIQPPVTTGPWEDFLLQFNPQMVFDHSLHSRVNNSYKLSLNQLHINSRQALNLQVFELFDGELNQVQNKQHFQEKLSD